MKLFLDEKFDYLLDFTNKTLEKYDFQIRLLFLDSKVTVFFRIFPISFNFLMICLLRKNKALNIYNSDLISSSIYELIHRTIAFIVEVSKQSINKCINCK